MDWGWKKKVVSLATPYCLWAFLIDPIFFLHLFGANYMDCIYTVLWYPERSYWFLITLFFLQIYLFLIRKVADFISKRLGNYMIWEMIFTLLMLILLRAVRFVFPDQLYFSSLYFIVFMSGYFARRYFDKLLKEKWIFTFALIIFGCFCWRYDNNHPSMLIKFIVSYTSFIILMNVSMSIMGKQFQMQTLSGIILDLFLFWGRNTLCIYILHFKLIELFEGALNPDSMKLHTDILPIPLFFMLFFISMPICHLCSVLGSYLKRTPILSYSMGQSMDNN